MGKLRKKSLQELMQERATGTGNQSAYTTEPRKQSTSVKSQVDRLYKKSQPQTFSEKVSQRYNQIMNDIGKISSNFITSTGSNLKSSLYYIESASNQNFGGYNLLNQQQAVLKEQEKQRQNIGTGESKNVKLPQSMNIREREIYQKEDAPMLRKATESPIQKAIGESIQKDEEKTQQNIESTQTKVGKKLAELTPSINQSLIGLGMSAINPALGMGYFQTSAGGNYTREAKAKGMNDQQAFTYGTVMGALESATESIGNKLTTNVGKTFFKDGAKEGLKAFGLDIAENFLEESVMEPLSEYVTQLTGGQADWENIGQRMLESGLNGAISSVIMGGASAGIGKAVQLVNKAQNGEQVTQKEIADTLKEINKSEEVEIEKLLFDSFKFTADDLMRNTDAQNRTNQKLDTFATDISKNEFAGIKPTSTMQNEPILKQEQQSISKQRQMAENQTSQQIQEQLGIDSENFAKQVESVKNRGVIKKATRSRLQLPRTSNSVDTVDNVSTSTNSISQVTSNIQEEKLKINDSDRKNIQELTKYNIAERKDASKIEMVKPKDIIKNISSIGNRDAETVNVLVDDIKESGIKKPIYISKETGKIVNGTHRLIIANELGLEEVPVKYINSSNDIVNEKDDWYNILEERRDTNGTRTIRPNERNGNERGDNNRRNEIINKIQRSTGNDRLYQGIQEDDKRPSTEAVYGRDSTMGRGIDENSKESSFLLPKKKILNPTEISNLKIEDANTTPELTERRTTIGNKESSFLKNISVKSKFLNVDFRNELADNESIKYYNGISNIDTLNKAYEDLQKNGQNATLKWFNKEASDATAEDVATGWILLKQYQDAGDYKSAVEIAKKMRDIGSTAGQTVQAFNILSRLTPDGMFYYAQKELSDIYSEMVKGKSQEWIEKHQSDFDLTPTETQFIKDTMEEVSKIEDEYERKVKIAEIQKIITDKIPATAGKSIKAWMRISMLFNPKTQVRNVVGNAITLPVNLFSDMFSSAIDKQIAKKTGIRTTGNLNIKEYGKGFGKGLYQSYNDFRKGINTRNIEGNRFEVTEGKSFKDKGIGKALNFTDNMLNFVMDAGDRGFYEATFVNSINNQLVLNNTTEVTQEMIDIATQEALSRTWQDNNAYTQTVLTIRNALNGKVGKHKGMAYGLGDVIIPFAKTPANLTKAIVDYSPVGLVKTLALDAKRFSNSLENGQYDVRQQHKFVQNLGKGMAGSLLYILGYALANAGVISGEADEDKDVKNFMRNSLGIGSYSIKIGDKSFAYDWAQPLATPLAIMSNYVKYSKDNPDASAIDKAINAVNIGTEQLLEQSFMESINTVLNGNGTTLENLTQAVMELPSRAIPTFSKQIADLVDPTQRTTFEYDKPVQSAINSVKAKLPVVSKSLPAQVDTLGNQIQKYGGDNSIFNVFFNPANMNKGTLTKAGKEIYDLYKETGNTAIFPRTAPYYINHKNEKITMDAQQRAEYQKVTGKYVERNLKNLLNDKDYLRLTSDEKAEFLEEIVADSNSKAKYEILGIESEAESKKRTKIENVGEKTYYNFNIKLDELQREKDKTNETVKDSEKISVLYNSDYDSSTKGKVYEYMLNGNKDETYTNLKTLTGDKVKIEDYLGYKTTDISAEDNPYSNIKGKTISGSKKKKLVNYLNSSKFSGIERLYIYGTQYSFNSQEKAGFENYVNNKIKPTNTERKELYKKLKDYEELEDGRYRLK